MKSVFQRAAACASTLLLACGQGHPAASEAPGGGPCAPAGEIPAASDGPGDPAAERDPRLPPLGVLPTNPPPAPGHVRWIVAGGGAAPVDNQVSIEDDLALAVERFRGDGVLLFAGGAGSHGVQILDQPPRSDRLTVLLGDLFDPRGGRNTHYRPTRLQPHGPATPAALLDAVGAALERPSDAPLTIYLAGHGVPAARRVNVQLAMWGSRGLVPADLAAVLDGASAQRPVRLVMTSCFSGAFAETLFTAADPTRGVAPRMRCGLFAATWDRPSSGCDPDPDRRLRASYGPRFLNALAGRDLAGAPLDDAAAFDLDGDGEISLLEAHTQVRMAAAGFDVPTTTSERWLRRVARTAGWPLPLGGAAAPTSASVAMPEEDAVIAALGERLGATDEAAVTARVAALQARLSELETALSAASEAEDDAGDRFAAETLARWPVLDDPWHPDYAATLASEREAILGWFRSHADYHAYRAANETTTGFSNSRDEVLLELAPWLTLQRALETLRLAGYLAARGGPDLATFNALRACERGAAP